MESSPPAKSCVSYADPTAASGAVEQDGSDARQQSAAPASLYCLFSLTRCREQESRPRFLTNEDNSRDHIVRTDCVSDKLSQLLKSTPKPPFLTASSPQERKMLSKKTCQGHMGHMTHHRCPQTSTLMFLFLRPVRAQKQRFTNTNAARTIHSCEPI